MTTVNLSIQLPESLAEQARAAGLLTSDGMARLLAGEMRRREAEGLRRIVSQSPLPESAGMTDDEVERVVQSEIDAIEIAAIH